MYPHLNVSKIIVKRTNFPKSGTTSEVGGMISASSRKNTVRDSKMLMDRLTYQINIIILFIIIIIIFFMIIIVIINSE